LTEKKKPGPDPDIIKIPLGFKTALQAGLKTGTPPSDELLAKQKRRKRKPQR